LLVIKRITALLKMVALAFSYERSEE